MTENRIAVSSHWADHRLRWLLVLFLGTVMGGIFFANEQNFKMLMGQTTLSPEEYRENDYSADVDDTEEHIEAGSNLRRVAFPMLGLVGLILVWQGRRKLDANVVLAFFAICLYGWCMVSFVWSAAPTLTIKRLIVLSACVVAIVGFARNLSLHELVWVAVVISSGLVGFSLAYEVKSGLMALGDGNYRFAGAVHPNNQAAYCNLLVLSAFSALMIRMRDAKLLRLITNPLNILLLGAFLAGLGLLALTKSRSTLGGCVLVMFIAWLLTVSKEKRALGMFAAPVMVIAIIGTYAVGLGSASDVQKAASFGRSSDGGVGGLNGRVPLWIWCARPLSRSPLVGYGYDSFWLPDQIQQATADLDWTVPNAHNVVIDVMLGLGLVGGALFVVLSAACLWISCQRLAKTRDPVFCFPVAIGLFALTNCIFESGFGHPGGADSFFLYAAMVMTAVLPAAAKGSDNEEAGEWGESRDSASLTRHAALPGWGRPSLGTRR